MFQAPEKSEDRKTIKYGFSMQSNFRSCEGALDNRYIFIRASPESRLNYYN